MRLLNLLAVALATLVGASTRPICPMPTCSRCLSEDVFTGPGIGIDLTLSYGTSVAHLMNGSVIEAAKVEATSDYRSLLATYLNASPPPKLQYFEKWRRFFNKQLGRPASREVEILSTMLIALRDETISVLSPPHPYIDRVVVTQHPSLTGLRSEDLGDALKYAGLRSWFDLPTEIHAGQYPSSLSQAHATFAAYGQGLCQNYTNLFMCWFEEEDMPPHVVLATSLTQDALSLSGGYIISPFHYSRPPLLSATNMSYGLAGVNNFTSPDEFWARVGNYIKDTAQKILESTNKPFTDLFLLGDNSTHPEFLRVLRESLAGLTVDNIATKTDIVDPTFAAGSGAALYGRWRQESPYGCMERNCAGKRKKREGRWDRTYDWLSYLGKLVIRFFRGF